MSNHARMPVAPLLAALLLFAVASPSRAAYHALETLPVESPVYRMVEDLAASYGFGSAFLHTQPWERADLGRFLDELALNRPGAAADPLVVRLRRELEGGAGLGGWDALVQTEDERSSLELSPYARADFSEDRARRAIVRDFRAGVQASIALGDGLLAWTDFYSGTTSAGGHGNPADSRHFGLIEGVQLNSYFDRGTLTWRGRWGRLQAGHTWLRWGPGAWGTLALSDGAPAFDVIEARVPIPGHMQLDWFVASLDPLSQSYLAGHRLELRPTSTLDVSFSELARFDGTATAPQYLMPLVPFTLIEKRLLKSTNASADSTNRWAKNNLMWAADVAWRWRPGVRLYGELAVDDISFSSEKRPRALAWQLGFEARRVRGGHAWTARGEYSRVYQFTYSVFHHHDFSFHGYSTSFPLGPDVDRLNARIECRSSPEWAFGIEGAYVRKGEGQLGDFYVPGSGAVNNLVLTGVLDVDARTALTADYSPAPGLSGGITAGWAAVTALGHVSGADEAAPYGSTRLTLRW